ncbi:MAG: hypothetical protein K2O78_03905 [Muribaculaceae bacterium]|nr:hypothetical protein [Muribaculaceae bacterium]
MKRFVTTMLSGVALLMASAQTTDVIFEQPEGLSDEYLMTYSGFYASMELEYFNDMQATVTLVMDTEGKFYFSNIFPLMDFGTWVTGQMTYDNTVELQLPQTLYVQEAEYDDEDDAWYDLQVFEMDEDGMPWPVTDPDKNLLVFEWGDDGSLQLRPLPEGYSIGINVQPADMWMGMSMTSIKYEDAPDSSLVTPPDGVTGKKYSYITYGMGNAAPDPKDFGYRVEFAFDGDDAYIGGLSLDLPSVWVKGQRDGNRIVMPSGQSMGQMSVMNVTLQYCKEDENALGGYSLLPDDTEFVWVYDEESDTYKAEDPSVIIIFNTATDGSIKFLQMVEDPELVYQPDTKGVPMSPWGLTYYERGRGENFDILDFNLPMLTVDGVLLPREQLSYRLYMDDEQIEVLAEDFDSGVDMWDVPYDFDRYLIVCNRMNTAHEVGFRVSGYESLGVQLVNTCDGEEYASDVVTYVVDDSGVHAVDAAEVTEETLFDLNGMRSNAATGGIYVKRSVLSDGSVRYSKVAVTR